MRSLLDRLSGEPAPEPAETPPLGRRLGHLPDLHAVLAQKVLLAHLRQRDQQLTPPPSDLRHTDPAEAELMICAMIAAAQADGHFDDHKRARIRAALASAGLPGFTLDLDQPQCLEALVRQVSSAQVAAHFYGVSVTAVDKARPVNRAYLQYLAQRLGLPADQVVRVNRRLGLG